ncbi:MAG: riboflavin synthase [Candidatus Omnitrophica bacterium]|nr:riboflavin synthase [Candidatus Omnitrophota bacterium]
MFTGIIEEVGEITGISGTEKLRRFNIACKTVLADMKIGDSIAVDGVCLTVVHLDKKALEVEVMKETLDKTTFGRTVSGMKVNLERALSAQGRLSGHFVTGHIDGMGRILNKSSKKGEVEMSIGFPEEIAPYLIPKGSVAVDGISLTIGRLEKNSFTVYLIPHTLNVTTLGEKSINGSVNLEGDILGKYIHRYLTSQGKENSKITPEFLEEHGII